MSLKRDREGEVMQSTHRANDAMRQHWNSTVCKEFNIPSHYQSVAVLLIHWADWLDKNLKCRTETAELEELFRDKFGFLTTTVVLDCKRKLPQHQLNSEVSKFMFEHDGPHRTTLLIVYYSGHGYTRPGKRDQLYISGTLSAQPANAEKGYNYEAACHWQNTESLLQHAEADVLTIMDTCFAATSINKSTKHVTRSYETIAATHEYTRAPGPSSFTRALIDSLSELHGEATKSEDRPFDTSRLHNRIMDRMSPEHNLPPLFNRNESLNARHICLAPILKTAIEQQRRVERAAGVLKLQVVFSKNRELSKDETTRLCRELVQGAKDADLNITALDWISFEPRPLDIDITVAIAVLLKAWFRRWRAKRRSLRDQIREQTRGRSQEPDGEGRSPKRLRLSSVAGPQSPLTPPGNV